MKNEEHQETRLNDDKSYGTPTTRKYPRSLLEAFPKSAENFEWFFPPEKNETLSNVLVFWVGVVGWILFLWFF